MIKRVYFLKARQENKEGGFCHSFRCVVHYSWLPKHRSEIVSDFFNGISEENDLPADGWLLEAFNRV